MVSIIKSSRSSGSPCACRARLSAWRRICVNSSCNHAGPCSRGNFEMPWDSSKHMEVMTLSSYPAPTKARSTADSALGIGGKPSNAVPVLDEVLYVWWDVQAF